LGDALDASDDVTAEDWRICVACGGGPDRSAQVPASNLTYPGRYLFTQTDPYPRVAILPEVVFGAIIGTMDLIDCVPLEKLEGQPSANGHRCWIPDNPWPFRRPLAPGWQARPVRGA
jgi:hypothetical protein